MLKQYFIHTYGCQMNVHESEKLAGILQEKGYEPAGDQTQADIILFNTCSIRETAETKVLGNLSIVKKLKERKPSLIVGVCGCMTQKKDAALRLKKRCPFVDIIFGTHNLTQLGQYLEEYEKQGPVMSIWDQPEAMDEHTPVFRSSGINAWVNIMYGCNNFCSYCIVPFVRGKERSREPQNILSDIKHLLSEGYKEITLLGQNVNSYANDFNEKSVSFASLLSDIADLDGNFRVRFMTSHPKDLSLDVVKIIAQSHKIGKFIHLPVQSGSDTILKQMNRRYTQKQYLDKIEMIRTYLPQAGLSSDILIGFPGEREEDFQQTASLVGRVRFNNLYTFMYSKRPGTVAESMDGQIDIATKRRRIRAIIDQQFSIAKAIAADSLNKTFQVLCDSYADGKAGGKTDCGKAVTFSSEKNCYGMFVNVQIEKNKNSKLYGRRIGE